MMNKFISLTIVLLTIAVTHGHCYGQSPTYYTPSELNWYINALQREMGAAQEQLQKIKDEKGYDTQAQKLLSEASTEIRGIEDKLRELKEKKMPTSSVLINMSSVKEKRNVLKDNLVSLGALTPTGPKTFPERCVIYKAEANEKGDELAKKEGLEKKFGHIQQGSGTNTLFLTVSEANDPTRIVHYQLDDKVGLIGSYAPEAPQIAKKLTPAQTYVTAWVDVASKKVVCVTKPIAYPNATQ